MDRVGALVEDVDLEEWWYAVEDEQLSSVNSEDTYSQDHQNTQTDNSFVTEQTDPDPALAVNHGTLALLQRQTPPPTQWTPHGTPYLHSTHPSTHHHHRHIQHRTSHLIQA